MDNFVELANRLADVARAIVLPNYRARITVEDKPDNTPVTAVDRAVETELRRQIGLAYPDHGFIGEETPPHQPDAEYAWIVDPIDGTKAFLCGIPVFGTLIALTHRGNPILGVIEQPVNRERWLGVQGRPTTLNGAPVTTRTCPGLGRARLCATAPEMFTGSGKDGFERLANAVKMTRYGTDCYAYGLLACGFVDLVVEAGLSPYDYLAHAPIVHGAGGVMTDWTGRALTLHTRASRVAAAGDRDLHRAVLAVL
ncbi:MAG: myo-inositol-1(or 4)-monophosphatase/inositol-phosphate phosphatase / L-galactose 1-phosphate phosphatase / histidinol-phosphatase [Candidatus Kentron sp. G]|nr:MAG: myo-inositol-1(or 4)-monophosphatase/inositol-phosphate phosphatase / L-galactose 1-phosphate phosphatase / histidinol-phosphatase [Candidatus Kentron sp. G]VFN05873.1 MAG: myo-inositol-1(or 4)-monophosphatase/inositol-phosphate phosphatase / L-galactose 1-phosphate phosphatase / histidinol-phosphatase [Candidatus Kentron sp. G]VFN06445.1 MAG: myo-inositol-1(or 4)-monophosphatase/inositol-phosphate phosphatase / L-galactose 1-phosphate phosphatase / histidinol-phosphatase [Candidatus Kent